MTAQDVYPILVKKLKEIDYLDQALKLLEWDTQVGLPPKAIHFRSSENAALSGVIHKLYQDPQLAEVIQTLQSERKQLTADQIVVVDEAAREHRLNTALPLDFVERKVKAQNEGFHAWVDARAKSDFSLFAPYLKNNLELAQEEARLQGFGKHSYDYWLDQYDTGMTNAVVKKLFGELKAELVPFSHHILELARSHQPLQFGTFPQDKQARLIRRIAQQIGFDFEAGRLDSSVHPFCSGNAVDVRLTTRYKERDPIDSLSGVIHEAGHGMYEQGLPVEHLGTALGKAVGMTVHESQSRIWENQVGRSVEFWAYWEPFYRHVFPRAMEHMTFDDFYLAINAVKCSPIRVESDEVTYNLHIFIRHEIEQLLFSGDIKVEELPHHWNKISAEILGYTPKDDAEGVLQDMHWSTIHFGYFPCYALGNLLAAQLWEVVNRDILTLGKHMKRGEFNPFLAWMREKIHSQGKRYLTLELCERATGAPLSAKPLINYLKQRYLPLYA